MSVATSRLPDGMQEITLLTQSGDITSSSTDPYWGEAEDPITMPAETVLGYYDGPTGPLHAIRPRTKRNNWETAYKSLPTETGPGVHKRTLLLPQKMAAQVIEFIKTYYEPSNEEQASCLTAGRFMSGRDKKLADALGPAAMLNTAVYKSKPTVEASELIPGELYASVSKRGQLEHAIVPIAPGYSLSLLSQGLHQTLAIAANDALAQKYANNKEHARYVRIDD